MRTTKELLAGLLKQRLAIHGPEDGVDETTQKDRKVVYFVFTDKIQEARQRYISLAKTLHQAIEYAESAKATGSSPDGIAHNPSTCTVHFTSKSEAKHAAEFLADIVGFWLSTDAGKENTGSYDIHDKTIRCDLDHVCFFFDPNGFMDFDCLNHPAGQVITIGKVQSQFAKKYYDVFVTVSNQGIIPDWPYDTTDRELIWETHQAKLVLMHLILSSCSDNKPRPLKQVETQHIAFKFEGEGVDILVNGEPYLTLRAAKKRAVLALACEDDLLNIDLLVYSKTFDPHWTESNTRTRSKKFKQAMASLTRAIPSVESDSLGNGKGRVLGIHFEKKYSKERLKKQIAILSRSKKDSYG